MAVSFPLSVSIFLFFLSFHSFSFFFSSPPPCFYHHPYNYRILPVIHMQNPPIILIPHSQIIDRHLHSSQKTVFFPVYMSLPIISSPSLPIYLPSILLFIPQLKFFLHWLFWLLQEDLRLISHYLPLNLVPTSIKAVFILP